eukprot:10597054-Heterocapsa_arctica.AAC.1
MKEQDLCQPCTEQAKKVYIDGSATTYEPVLMLDGACGHLTTQLLKNMCFSKGEIKDLTEQRSGL